MVSWFSTLWNDFLRGRGNLSYGRRIRMLEELGLYPRRGQRNTALLALMKQIEADLVARQVGPIQGIALVDYAALEGPCTN